MVGKLRNLFRRRKKKKESEIGVFGVPIVIPEKIENKNSFIAYTKNGFNSFKRVMGRLAPKRKYRIKYLLKVKRIFAGLLCIIYLFSWLTTIPAYISIFFFLTWFFLLDYIWKTRLIKWVSGEEEP